MLTSQEIERIDTAINSSSDSIFEVPGNSEAHHRIYDIVDHSILLSSYNDVFYYKELSLQQERINSRLLIVQVTSTVASTKKMVQISEVQLLGIKMLDTDYGHILIRPETMEDKINEFFNKAEMDFNDFPRFSSRYYYISRDLALGKAFATNDRLALIEKQKDILIEVKENIMIAKYPRVFNDLDFKNLLELIKRI